MPKVKIYSASACPFAQRSRLVLLEKGVDFELIEIDLQNKPDWFGEVSPYGKVPVIQFGDDRIWESTIINEYLEEVVPEPPLMPGAAGLRAIARIWIDFANTKFTTAFYKLLLSQELEKQQEWEEELQQHFRLMEMEGLRKLSEAGPYWLGESLSLVDLAFYPWFERLPALEYYRGVAIPVECFRLREWWMVMQLRDSVQATIQSAEFHIEQYAKYANNSASGVTAQELRRY
ncbi:glutathione S-transferase family protein [Leptothermofonsia sp. ETS-13]|uniref:glutathione S-transferase family protein n=1 Tax=Leptothermofonsia sp. ETS-13 TaxID=3035696 RepID=UPI003BA1492E